MVHVHWQAINLEQAIKQYFCMQPQTPIGDNWVKCSHYSWRLKHYKNLNDFLSVLYSRVNGLVFLCSFFL